MIWIGCCIIKDIDIFVLMINWLRLEVIFVIVFDIVKFCNSIVLIRGIWIVFLGFIVIVIFKLGNFWIWIESWFLGLSK